MKSGSSVHDEAGVLAGIVTSDNLMCASFREGYPGKVHPLDRPEGAAMAEAGHNLLPVDQVYGSQTSPIFNYPYRRSRPGTDRLSRYNDYVGTTSAAAVCSRQREGCELKAR